MFVSRHEVFPAWRTVEEVRDDEEAAERDRFSGGWWSTQTVLDRTWLQKVHGGRGAGLRGERVREGRYVKFDAGMDELLQYSSTGVDNRETIQNLGRAS